jgi:hypothetical protein
MADISFLLLLHRLSARCFNVPSGETVPFFQLIFLSTAKRDAFRLYLSPTSLTRIQWFPLHSQDIKVNHPSFRIAGSRLLRGFLFLIAERGCPLHDQAPPEESHRPFDDEQAASST